MEGFLLGEQVGIILGRFDGLLEGQLGVLVGTLDGCCDGSVFGL